MHVARSVHSLLFGAVLITVAGCGGSSPWDKEPREGLWRQTYTEGQQAGNDGVICYAAGQGITLYHDSQAAATENGATCEGVQRTATDTGWYSTQKCTLGGKDAIVRYEATGDAETGAKVRLTVNSEQGAELSPAQAIDIRRIGDCPGDWKPGDALSLNSQDGTYRLIHPGSNGAMDTYTILDAVPPAVKALLH